MTVLKPETLASGDTNDTEWTTINSSTVEGNWKARAGDNATSSESTLVKLIDTSGFKNITITFSHQDNGLEDDDSVRLQTTYTGGSFWIGPDTELKESGSGWSEYNYTFTGTTADDEPSFGFRFVATLDSKSDQFDLDDVVVTGEKIEPSAPTLDGVVPASRY